jgi:hypothetical protein
LNIPELVQLVNFRATGKPNAPTSGSKKYNQIINAGQFFLRSFNEEPYPNLLGEARERMTKMKENAGARIDEIYRPNFLDSED